MGVKRSKKNIRICAIVPMEQWSIMTRVQRGDKGKKIEDRDRDKDKDIEGKWMGSGE